MQTQELVIMQNELECLLHQHDRIDEEIDKVRIQFCDSDRYGREFCVEEILDEDKYFDLQEQKDKMYDKISALRQKIRSMSK